jgi:hypothetical protein
VHPGLAGVVALLSLSYVGVLSGIVLFWPMPSARLGVAVAGGIAAINSCGNLAGYASGLGIGMLRDQLGNTASGFLFVGASLVLSALFVMLAERTPIAEEFKRDYARAGGRS